MRPHFEGQALRTLGYYWGITGVILLLSTAVYRLAPRVFELRNHELSPLHWLLLLAFVAFMLYLEGYKGFHLNFAPRVIVRAVGVQQANKLWLTLLAPLVCMGFVYATKKRQVISFLLTLAIVSLVLLVSHLAQPWRGIIDAGVVLGLLMGTLSLVWHWLRRDLFGITPGIAADLP